MKTYSILLNHNRRTIFNKNKNTNQKNIGNKIIKIKIVKNMSINRLRINFDPYWISLLKQTKFEFQRNFLANKESVKHNFTT